MLSLPLPWRCYLLCTHSTHSRIGMDIMRMPFCIKALIIVDFECWQQAAKDKGGDEHGEEKRPNITSNLHAIATHPPLPTGEGGNTRIPCPSLPVYRSLPCPSPTSVSQLPVPPGIPQSETSQDVAPSAPAGPMQVMIVLLLAGWLGAICMLAQGQAAKTNEQHTRGKRNARRKKRDEGVVHNFLARRPIHKVFALVHSDASDEESTRNAPKDNKEKKPPWDSNKSTASCMTSDEAAPDEKAKKKSTLPNVPAALLD